MSVILAPMLKYLCGGLAFVALMLGIALKLEQRHSHKLEQRVTELSATLQRISSERDEQRKVTAPLVKQVVEGKRNPVAEKIEGAKSPGLCRTPSEILDAEI